MTTAVLRAATGDQLRLHRAAAVVEQQAILLRGRGYWWLMLSGFVEPVFYLLAVGWGIGSMVGSIPVGDGRSVSYLTFLAPALLATSAMNGALIESGVNFFIKITGMKVYDAVLNTPATPTDIALGELAWSMVRGGIYSGVFLALMAALHVTTPWLALVALPATVLVGFAFGALGLVVATVMRTFADYDYVSLAQSVLFLFSGTFVPISTYPAVARFVVELTPLYRGVDLIRGITLGQFGWTLVLDVLYLLGLIAVGVAVASRRLLRKFRV
jgi:lipooligosaccharide transport system permease protein